VDRPAEGGLFQARERQAGVLRDGLRHDRHAQPGLHQLDQQRHVRRLADAILAHARLGETAGDHRLDATAAEVEERLVVELGEPDAAPALPLRATARKCSTCLNSIQQP
jgi:hypothetical protein